jgi:hypothetical protein
MTEREAVYRLLISWDPLRQVVGDNVYPGWVTDKPFPYVTVTRISKVPVRCTTGNTGLFTSRLQLDLYGRTQAECDLIEAAVRGRFNDYSGELDGVTIQQAYLPEAQDFPEPPVASGSPVFRQSLDLIVWWNN